MNQKSYKLLTVVCGTLILLNLQGCATVTKGSSQPLTISTKPQGAACNLNRDDETIAVVNPTPGTITIEKDKDDITISCKKDGYMEAINSLSSKVQGWTFGNILLGGLIGFAIDAGSGAMNDYPGSFNINLIPEKFASEHDKDNFFDGLRDEVIKESNATHDLIKDQCKNNTSSCNKNLKDLEDAEKSQLDKIEKQRSNAKVDTAIISRR